MKDYTQLQWMPRMLAGLPSMLAMSLLVAVETAGGATIWNGSTTTFTKAPFADPTLQANQDRLTANVWITRGTGGSGGIYNATTETSYTHSVSPSDTEWAYGQLSDYTSLTYTSWEGMFGGVVGGGPPSSIGKDAVVHLKTDDIYLSIKLLSWGVESGGGGSFSYVRSTPSAGQPPPPRPALTNAILLGGSFQFSFTNTPGYIFSILATTNASLPFSNWTVLGALTDNPAGSYRFSDPAAVSNSQRRFFMIRWP